MCLVQNNFPWVILEYLYIILLFSSICYLKQIISLKPILSQYNPNNWLFIGRWSIDNMLHQYYRGPACDVLYRKYGGLL